MTSNKQAAVSKGDKPMHANRQTTTAVAAPRTIALVTGILFVITYVTSIPPVLFLYVPVLHDPRYIVGAGADNGAPRVIHTCFPASPVPDNVPPGTVRDCTPPIETCVQDGLPCAAAWGAPPRKLEDCRHQPGQTPPCGETPEWYEAELLSPRVLGPKQMDDPIVFVEGAASPVFTLSGTLHALETRDETDRSSAAREHAASLPARHDVDVGEVVIREAGGADHDVGAAFQRCEDVAPGNVGLRVFDEHVARHVGERLGRGRVHSAIE